MIWSIISPYTKIEIYIYKKIGFFIRVCLIFFKNYIFLLVNFYGSVPWVFNKNVLRGKPNRTWQRDCGINPCTAPFFQPKELIQTAGTILQGPSWWDSGVSNSSWAEHNSHKSVRKNNCTQQINTSKTRLGFPSTQEFTALLCQPHPMSFQLRAKKQKGQFWSCYFNSTKKRAMEECWESVIEPFLSLSYAVIRLKVSKSMQPHFSHVSCQGSELSAPLLYAKAKFKSGFWTVLG